MDYTKYSPHLASPNGRGITSRAFTLVELIVVVTILAILATIGFVSYSSYLTWVRDTNRLAQLVSIHDWLELFRTKKDLPLPDESVDVVIDWETIAFQWFAGSNVLETIDFTKWGQDPRDGVFFSYYLTDDRKFFQLMAFLEEETNITAQNNNVTSPLRRGIEGDFVAWNISLINSTQAVDYSSRVPTIYGKKLWILTNTANTPIQDIPEIITAWSLDISGWEDTSNYVAHLTDTSALQWTATDSPLQYLESVWLGWWVASSCKTLIDRNSWLRDKDWVYVIDPEGGNPFPVYCEMTTDWGGWTLVDNVASNSDTMLARTKWTNVDLTTTKGNLLPAHSWSWDPQILCKADFYNGTKPWLTVDVLTDEAELYPTSNSLWIPINTSWDFSINTLNWNTDNGANFFYNIWLWLWSWTATTCACGYIGVNGWLWFQSTTTRICSTYVR